MAKGKGGFIGQDGLNAPDAPTGVSGTAGNEQVTVSWTNPTDVGGSAITNYVISSNPSVPIEPPSLTTASYTSKSFSLSGQGTYNYYAMTFNGDGTKAYFTGFGPDAILQYSLSTAWDISTASYDSVSLDVSGQTTAGQSGLVFSPDGSKIYMASYTPDAVYQYNLSTPYDVSTGSYSNNSLTVNEDTNVQDVYLKPDGTKLFVLGDTNNSVFQYTMSTPFDLSTASYDSVSFATTTQQTNCTGLFFSPDGTIMLICGYSPVQADKYILSTPWDITTASHDSDYDLTGEFGSNSPNAIFAGNDLNNLFVGGSSGSGNGAVYQYAVGMPTGSPFVYGGLTNGTSYTFNVWAINAFGWSVVSDASDAVSPAAPPLAVFFNGSGNNVIDYVNISTTGNATDWGDHDSTSQTRGSAGSSTRGVSASFTGHYDYITYATTGNAVNFGDINPGSGYYISGVSSSTRGVFYSAQNSNSDNFMEYITIASTGNGTDYGDMSNSAYNRMSNQVTSPTRGLFCGGRATSTDTNTIRYVTIATTGNDTNFGNLTQARFNTGGASSNTRGLIAGGAGNGGSNIYNIIDYVTIASTGNATDFGDLIGTKYSLAGTSSGTRAVFNGGYNSGYSAVNSIDYVTIGSTGNATDFGDMTTTKIDNAAIGSAHGGLQ